MGIVGEGVGVGVGEGEGSGGRMVARPGRQMYRSVKRGEGEIWEEMRRWRRESGEVNKTARVGCLYNFGDGCNTLWCSTGSRYTVTLAIGDALWRSPLASCGCFRE